MGDAVQALQQTLAEILQAATAQQSERLPPPTGSSLKQLLEQQPHWAATAAAAAAHPALHLAIRQTLHHWLAASGNPAVWRLLLLYFNAVRSGHCGQQQPLDQHLLPLQLRLLYPAALAGVAALLHTEQPSSAGLDRAVARLQRFLSPPASQPAEDGSQAWQHLQQHSTAAGAAAAAGPPHAEQHVGQMLLDAPAWLLFCLQQLPLQQLLQLAAAEAAETGPSGAVGGSAPAAAAAAAGQEPAVSAGAAPAAAAAAAAEYAALLMWPGYPRRRRVLAEALQLDLADVDLAAVQPWLITLVSWQQMLQEAAA